MYMCSIADTFTCLLVTVFFIREVIKYGIIERWMQKSFEGFFCQICSLHRQVPRKTDKTSRFKNFSWKKNRGKMARQLHACGNNNSYAWTLEFIILLYWATPQSLWQKKNENARATKRPRMTQVNRNFSHFHNENKEKRYIEPWIRVRTCSWERGANGRVTWALWREVIKNWIGWFNLWFVCDVLSFKMACRWYQWIKD